MNEHVNLVVEQYQFGADETGRFVKYHGKVAKMYRVVLHNVKSKSKASSSMHKNLMLGVW